MYIDSQGRIYLEKIGHIRCKSKTNLQGVRFYNVRVKFEAGKWLLKCAVHTEDVIREQTLRSVNMGIDLGVKVLAVVSCGGHKRVFKNINRHHKLRRLNRQLKHHQRALARKKKGSRNHMKARIRVRKIYGRIQRIRYDYVQKTTRAIIDMSCMMKNKHLANSTQDLFT